MKKNKKLWSWALAGALAVSNLSVVAAPFTSIMAQAATGTVTLTGVSNDQVIKGTDIVVAGVTPATEKTLRYEIKEITSEKEKGAQATAEDASWSVGAPTGTSATISTTELTADKLYAIRVADTAEDPASVYSKIFEVVDPTAENSISEITGTVKNIPTADFKATEGVKSDDLVLSASETFPQSGGEDITWKIYGPIDDDASTDSADATDNFTIVKEPASFPVDQFSPFTQQVTITANSAAYAPEIGDYEVVAYPGTQVDKAQGSYTFTVVDNPVANPDKLLVKDKNQNLFGGATINKEVELRLWNDNAQVDLSKITWKLDEDTQKIATLTSNKLKVTKQDATVTPTVSAIWEVAPGITYQKDTAFTVAADAYVVKVDGKEYTYTDGVPDAPVSLTSAGKKTTATAVITKNGEVISDVTWESGKEQVATVDSTGKITAVAAGEANIIATYSDGTKDVTSTIAVEVANLVGEYYVDDEAVNTTTGYPGKTIQVEYKNNDGTAIEGEVKWAASSMNNKITIDESTGLVSISADVADGFTGTIQALVDGKAVATTLTVNVVKPDYALTVSKASLFYGEEAELTATFGDEELTSGTFKMVDNADAFTITGNKIKATKIVNADLDDAVIGYWAEGSDLSKAADADTTITLKADVFETKADSIADWTTDTSVEHTTTQEAVIDSLEQGDTVKITATLGSQDLTSKMKWVTDPEKATSVTVSDGVITANEETAVAVTVKGSYTIDTETYAVEVKVTRVIANSGATKDAADAEQAANDAIASATEATDAAEIAEQAANDTIANPTVANLTEAAKALDDAYDKLEEANKALDEAKEALKKANDDEAVSEAAKAAVKAAEDAVADAEKAVADAQKAYDKAEETFNLAADDVEKAVADAIADANTKADAAVANPTDDTINAAKAAVETAKATGATDEELSAANAKIADAVAKKAAADEEAKKKAEEEAKAADGSAKGTPAPVNTEFKDASNKVLFKVTNADPKNPEVEFVGPADKDAKSCTVPDTYTDQSGNVYKVTSIAAKAFKDTKAKTVTIGKNIKSIDPDAFKDSKVKNAKIKGTKLTKKMAKAFKKLKKGGKIRVSGSNKKKNKKYLNALSNVKKGNTKVK